MPGPARDIIEDNFRQASQCRSAQGHPVRLGELMEKALKEGWSHRDSAGLAMKLGFRRIDVLAWMAGKRFMERRQGSRARVPEAAMGVAQLGDRKGADQFLESAPCEIPSINIINVK